MAPGIQSRPRRFPSSWPSASSTSSRSASGRRARTRSGRCARRARFVERLAADGAARRESARVRVELFGSLGADRQRPRHRQGGAAGPRRRDARGGRSRRDAGSGWRRIRGGRRIACSADARDRVRRGDRPGLQRARTCCRSTPTACASPRSTPRARIARPSGSTTRSAAASWSTRGRRRGGSHRAPTRTVLPYPFHSGDELLAHLRSDRHARSRS